MPLKLDFIVNETATLGSGFDLNTQFSQIPNFQAVFTAGDFDSTADNTEITQWDAKAGTGFFTTNNASFYPKKAKENGVSVVRFDGTDVFDLNNLVIGNVTEYTYGARFKIKTPTLDNAGIIGQNLVHPRAAVMQRYVNNELFFRYDSDVDFDTNLPTNGEQWVNLLVCQGGGYTKISINENPFVQRLNTSMNLPGFHIGAVRGNFPTAAFDFRNVIFIGSDVSTNTGNLDLVRLAIRSI